MATQKSRSKKSSRSEPKPQTAPKGKKLCPFCGTELVLKRRSVHRSQPGPPGAAGLPSLYARDELWKCPKCYFVAAFGIPLTPEEYERQLQEWGGERIEDYYLAKSGEERLLQRLKELGYI